MSIEEGQRQCLERVLNNFAEEIIKKELPKLSYKEVEVVVNTESLRRRVSKVSVRGCYAYEDVYTGEPTIFLEDDPNNLVFFHELIHHIQFLRAGEDANKAFPEEYLSWHERKHEIQAKQGSHILFHKYNKMIQKERRECYKLK